MRRYLTLFTVFFFSLLLLFCATSCEDNPIDVDTEEYMPLLPQPEEKNEEQTTLSSVDEQEVVENTNDDTKEEVNPEPELVNTSVFSFYSQSYDGEVTPESRYLSIGFDDFRNSDFNMVIPLFKKYGATATFNRIAWNGTLSAEDISKINQVLSNGNELGDHTFFHCNYIYTDALCNGQNPEDVDGDQIPFPSNEQLRNDFGGGKNAFGLNLDCSILDATYGYKGLERNLGFDNTWRNLTDEECQILRNKFSIYKDTSGKLAILDELSNRYLGTTGNSFGSFNEQLGFYTGGIFSGCKTSANHEIWERIFKITELFYKDLYGQTLKLDTWSFPGDWRSPFFFHKDDGKCYYDSEGKVLYNYLAKFSSSLSGQERSFVETIRMNGGGYHITHDTLYPSRADGVDKVAMSQQLILNASFSRKDALAYCTNSYVSYARIAKDYPASFFTTETNGKSKFTQMYEAEGSFYEELENLRHNTSNGLVHGEIIDSEDTYSERIFLEGLLEYCKKTGVEVISKTRAYDVCFNHKIENGNLIYNPKLRNTIKEFLPYAENLPRNPDGYTGDCYVEQEDTIPILIVDGNTSYIHYGIPVGTIKYSGFIQGYGNISIYAIKNNTSVSLDIANMELLGTIILSSDTYEKYDCSFVVPDNTETTYEQVCEGLGEKIMGIKIVYNGELKIFNIKMEKTI